MSNEHIVKSFAQELQRLSNLITQMGGVAEAQVEAAVQALVRRDTAIASQVIQSDLRIDAYEREVDNETLRLLALRQPMASDLRFITTTDFPPFSFIDASGRLSGFHVDLARAICAALEITDRCQIHALPWS